MKKIALVTEYGDVNIGNKLQNYAVQELCKENGYFATTFKYHTNYGKISCLKRIIARIGFLHHRARLLRLQVKREKVFNTFSSRYLDEIESVFFTGSLRQLIDRYDLFLVGSDQVWHDSSEERLNYFFLTEVPKSKRRCISPSFGSIDIPENKKELYMKGLNGFECLSCREQSGVDIIQELTGKKATLLCDPTMMLSHHQWDLVSERPQFTLPSKYVLVYYLGKMPESVRHKIDEFAARENIKAIYIYSSEYPQYYCTSPSEFLYMVKNADHVVTNSFHGCVFSIIYQKTFSVFDRLNNSGQAVMGTRIQTLLNMFNIEKCICRDEVRKDEMNYEIIQDRLNSEREKGKNWLSKNLC